MKCNPEIWITLGLFIIGYRMNILDNMDNIIPVMEGEDITFFLLESYAGWIRREEVPLTSLKVMMKICHKGVKKGIPQIIAYMGVRFKGEDGERHHWILLKYSTSSGLPIQMWFQILIKRRIRKQG